MTNVPIAAIDDKTTKVEKQTGTELSMFDKGRIIAKWEDGLGTSEISEVLGLPNSTVYNIISKFDNKGSVDNAKRPGRPRKASNENMPEANVN